MELYRHSGTMPLVGIPVVVLFGAGTATVLGFAYSYATVYCPIVYVNFLLTGLLGLGIGWAVAKGARIGKIRNNYVSGAYGLAFGLVGLYVAWVADMAARLGAMGGPAAGNFSQLVVAAFSPSVLWEYIQVFYDQGFWCISHHGQGGDTVKGVFLAIVWVLEGGAILACAAGCAYRMSAALPFCETCNRWTVLEKAVRRLLPLGLKADSVDRAVAGNVDGLTELARADGDPATCLELDLACCPNCQASNFLTIQLVQKTVDKKGKAQVSKKPLVTHMLLDAADVPRIRQAGRDPAELTAAEESAQGNNLSG